MFKFTAYIFPKCLSVWQASSRDLAKWQTLPETWH